MKTLILAALLGVWAAPSHAAGLPSPFTPFQAPKKAVSNPVSTAKTLTKDDLTAALADANAQTGAVGPGGTPEPAPYVASTVGVMVTAGSDTRHGNCWAALIDFQTTFLATNPLPGQLGLALAQQKIFDFKAVSGKPLLPDYVTHNCVDTFNDAGMELAQITAMLGIALPKIP